MVSGHSIGVQTGGLSGASLSVNTSDVCSHGRAEPTGWGRGGEGGVIADSRKGSEMERKWKIKDPHTAFTERDSHVYIYTFAFYVDNNWICCGIV